MDFFRHGFDVRCRGQKACFWSVFHWKEKGVRKKKVSGIVSFGVLKERKRRGGTVECLSESDGSELKCATGVASEGFNGSGVRIGETIPDQGRQVRQRYPDERSPDRFGPANDGKTKDFRSV